MKRKLCLFFLTAIVLLIASPAFAQGGAPAGAGNQQWVIITSGFAMAIASGVCGLAQSRATAAAVEGMARNPAASAAIRFALILGLALIESLALYTFVIIFMKVSVAA